MIRKRSWNKLLSVFLLLVLLAAVLPPRAFEAEAASASEEMQAAVEKKKELSAELERLKEELAAIKDSVEKYEEAVNTHAYRLQNVQAQIDELKIIIEELRASLSEAQAALDQKERELKESYRKFGQHLRTMYMNSNSTTLSVLLGADNFSDFLIAAEYTQRMNEKDAELIDRITALRDEVEAMRDGVNQNLQDQEDALLEQDRLYLEVAALLQEANSELSAAEAYESATQSDFDRIHAEYSAQQDVINNLMSTYNSNVPYIGGDFRWPVPGFDWISSPYGDRTLWGRYNFHTGIDIAGSGVMGAGVIASNGGTVHTAVYGSTGYGYFVIIDHGGGYMTLYGHLSAIYVSVGEDVAQGSVIGAVGSTGNSTGPHLHYEIRINGDKIDPETLVLRY